MYSLAAARFGEAQPVSDKDEGVDKGVPYHAHLAVCAYKSPATAQSLAKRQLNFDSKLDEMSRKPQSHITQQDAREMESTEVGIDNLSVAE